jgi:hypothetical protein
MPSMYLSRLSKRARMNPSAGASIHSDVRRISSAAHFGSM